MLSTNDGRLIQAIMVLAMCYSYDTVVIEHLFYHYLISRYSIGIFPNGLQMLRKGAVIGALIMCKP